MAFSNKISSYFKCFKSKDIEEGFSKPTLIESQNLTYTDSLQANLRSQVMKFISEGINVCKKNFYYCYDDHFSIFPLFLIIKNPSILKYNSITRLVFVNMTLQINENYAILIFMNTIQLSFINEIQRLRRLVTSILSIQ